MKLNKYPFMEEAGTGEGGAGGASATPAAGGEGDQGGAPASGTVLNGGETGAGENVPAFGEDGYKYSGKYDSVELLEKGYNDFATMHKATVEQLKGFVGAPESGEYQMPEGAKGYSQPVMDAMQQWGIDSGLSQESYDGLLGVVAKAEADNMTAYKEEQMGLLGKDAAARIQNANDKWTATYGAEATEWMQSKALSAQDVQMFESILEANAGSTVNPDGGQAAGQVMITKDQLSEAMFAKDSAGMMKMQTDPEYKKLVDDMTAKFNKQRGIS